MIEEQIISKMHTKTFGEAANEINDTAERVLSKAQFRKVLIKQNQDADDCEGMDGMFLNGEYFDWKQFEPRKDDMLRAFLRYFDTPQLELIANNLQKTQNGNFGSLFLCRSG